MIIPICVYVLVGVIISGLCGYVLSREKCKEVHPPYLFTFSVFMEIKGPSLFLLDKIMAGSKPILFCFDEL